MVDHSLEEFEKRHGQIVEAIGTAIADGTHSAGDQLVPESLGEDFGVSRTVIREALKVLEARGMVRVGRGSGTLVLPSSEWDLLDPDVIRWIGAESDRQVANLVALRSAVEPLAARQACQERTPESLTRLRAAIKGMREAHIAGDWGKLTDEYVGFRRALFAASGSMILEQLTDPVEAAIRADFQRERVRESMRDTTHVREVHNWHDAMVDAIEDRDEHTAELISRRITSLRFDDEVGTPDSPELIVRSDDGTTYPIRPSTP